MCQAQSKLVENWRSCRQNFWIEKFLGAENDQNVRQHREDNISEVLPVPPSDMSCNYTRGRCNRHGNMGEKYVISERKWRDRGQGRGYGYVSTKKVKYRCVGEKLQKRQNSTE